MDLTDDWLFDSVRRYRNLSMYDLNQGVSAMDWVENGNGVCVATSDGKKHELVELTLPDKMLDDQHGNLKKDRDFRVQTGALSKRQLTCVKHLPTTRYCVVVEDRSPTVSLWEMGCSSSDLMHEVGPLSAPPSLVQPIKIEAEQQAACKDQQPIKLSVQMKEGSNRCIAYGGSTNDIVIVDAKSFTKVADTSGCPLAFPVSVMVMMSESLTCCTNHGDIVILDTRRKNPLVDHREQTGKPASYWTMANDADQSNNLLQLSSSGEVMLVDTRCMARGAVATADCGLTTGQMSKEEHQMIQRSPDCSLFSISGFDGMVHIYQASDLSEGSILEPIFSHEGHVMCTDNQSDSVYVVQHMWHPLQQDLILSGATDGSLHAWQCTSREATNEKG